MFPQAFAIGVGISDFRHMTPKQLTLCVKGHKRRLEEEDRLVWQWFGVYGTTAVMTAMDRCLNGRKAKSQYIDKPLMAKDEAADGEKELTQEEKDRLLKKFMRSMEIRKFNFDLTHKKNDSNGT